MFEPLNNGHAISEVSFFFEFVGMDESDIKSMMSVYPNVKDVLPGNRPSSGMMFSTSPDGSFSMNQAVGAEWMRFKTDGNPEWIARINLNAVSLHCTEYEGWQPTWTRAFEVLKEIFGGLTRSVPLLNIGLKYVDQFDYKGDVNKYSALELIKAETPHVAPALLQSGMRWHNYSGWFSFNKSIDREILQQLNIDAVQHVDTNEPVITISHSTLLRGTGPGDLDRFFDFSHINNGLLGKFMNVAHEANHSLLHDLIRDDILQRIGMGKGE